MAEPSLCGDSTLPTAILGESFQMSTKSQRQIATPTLSIHLHGIEIALQKMSWN